jgi:hypothetical protein
LAGSRKYESPQYTFSPEFVTSHSSHHLWHINVFYKRTRNIDERAKDRKQQKKEKYKRERKHMNI